MSGFTLIELLIVIGVLAVISVAAVITLNPAEILEQQRDAKRVADLDAIHAVLKVLTAQDPFLNIGSVSTVYISLPSNQPDCSDIRTNLPAIPAGWQYRCAPATTYQKADGTGWIPLAFSQPEGGASLPSLPIDPQNTYTNYYSYVVGSSWQLMTSFESEKYAGKEALDGGSDPAAYEIGSNVTIAPFMNGLVGHWTFDEGSGTAVPDTSGYSNNGTGYSSTSVTDLHNAGVCRRGGCIRTDGIDDVVLVPSVMNDELNPSRAVSAIAWIYQNTTKGGAHVVTKGWGDSYGLTVNSNFPSFRVIGTSSQDAVASSIAVQNGQWVMVAGVYNGSQIQIYVNGEVGGTKNFSATLQPHSLSVGIGNIPHVQGGSYFNNGMDGYIDEVWIYGRALSASEIKAIYDSTK